MGISLHLPRSQDAADGLTVAFAQRNPGEVVGRRPETTFSGGDNRRTLAIGDALACLQQLWVEDELEAVWLRVTTPTRTQIPQTGAHLISVEVPEVRLGIEPNGAALPGLVTIVPAGTSATLLLAPGCDIVQIRICQGAWVRHVTSGTRAASELPVPVERTRQADPILEALAVALKHAASDPSGLKWLGWDGAIGAILSYVARAHSLTQPVPGRHRGGLSKRQLRRIIDFIDAHVGETIRLEQLSALVGISQSHLCEAFRQSTGRTPHQFHIARRIEAAQRMLSETDRSLAEIALMVGYCDQSQFGAAFRKLVGNTPGAYRRALPSEARQSVEPAFDDQRQ